MNMRQKAPSAILDLIDGWRVARVDGAHDVGMNVPGDVHSSLLRAGVITDPFWRDTEISLDWVHEADWIATSTFDFFGDITKAHTVTFASVDCHAEVTLNGVHIGTCDNQSIRWDFAVGNALREGANTLSVHFKSNSRIAAQKAKESSIFVPYLTFNNRLAHYNYLGKTQCNVGWDWNIALSPIGIYGDVTLRETEIVRFDDLAVRQCHANGTATVEVEVEVQVHANGVGQTNMVVELCGQTVERVVAVSPGTNDAKLLTTRVYPALWWPVGHGDLVLHDLTVTLGSEVRHRRIGLRNIELDTSEDAIGARFASTVNGREIFMRGANWIPADALPERGTPDVVRDRLTSAGEANFNMIRVWGGGQYEANWFYDLCSELGILVWHDFMFACNLYPSHDKGWLASVRVEARQQIRRLSSQPCMALWCGDNELVGALGWHNDTSGDVHFWDMWHSAKDFEHYRTVKPRFCSEFGFQSFPSMLLIETFTDPEDRSATSRVMDVLQRNDGDNEKIVHTISRYFNVPDTFEDMVYLSQVSQALAMKTSIVFWRSAKPRCMGTLYWQLNDTWPVASWASLEYGGHWKVTQCMARRFHDPVLVTAQPIKDMGDIVLWAVNDTPDAVSISVGLTRVDVAGPMAAIGTYACICPPDTAIEVTRVPVTDVAAQEFLSFTWRDVDGKHSGQNDYLPNRPKAYNLRAPTITVDQAGDTITLTSDMPALYATLNHGGADIYSDNGFTLLPNVEKLVTITRRRCHGDTPPPSIKFLS